MSETTEISYPMTEEELFFLSHMMKLKSIFGAKDPFRGYLVAEIEERYKVVKKELLKKGYLLQDENGELEIAPLLGACLLACGEDDGIQLAKRSIEGKIVQSNLYATKHIVAEISPNPEQEKGYVLRPLASAEQTLGELFFFFPEQQEIEEEWAVDISGMNIDKWLELELEEQASYLLQAGIEENKVIDALHAFQFRESQGAMRKWKRESNYWLAVAIQYVSYENRFYLASEQPGKRLRIETYNIAEVEHFLTGFCERFMIEEATDDMDGEGTPDTTEINEKRTETQ